MRIPTSVYDTRLLQDEPFLTGFASLGKDCRKACKVITTVAAALREGDYTDSIEAWIDHAFTHDGDGSLRRPNPKGSRAVHLFAEFYSCLARKNSHAGLVALNRAREKLGLEPLNSGGRSRKAPELSSGSVGSKSSISDKRSRPFSNKARKKPPANYHQEGEQSAVLIPTSRSLAPDNHCIGEHTDSTTLLHLSKNNARSSENREAHQSQKDVAIAIDESTNTQHPQSRHDSGNSRMLPRSNGSSKPPEVSVHQGQDNGKPQYKIQPAFDPIEDGHAVISLMVANTPASAEIYMSSGNDDPPTQNSRNPKKRPPPLTGTSGAMKRRAVSNGDVQLILDKSSNMHSMAVALRVSTLASPLCYGNGRSELPTDKVDAWENAGLDTKVELVETPLDPEVNAPLTTTRNHEVPPIFPLCVKAETGAFIPSLQLLDPPPPTPYKDPLPQLPPIWAQSRQEVCESFDWFRSYQGGVYHIHEMAKGYLLSGFPSSRDRFEHGGRLIISHGGGKAESIHSTKGQMSSHPASDQLARDKSVRALVNNYKTGRPLALLVDDKYALFPYDLGSKDVTYAILGFYVVEHVWAEYQQANNECGYVIRYKFAFRWCEDQGPPWWIPGPAPDKSATQSGVMLSDPLEGGPTLNDNTQWECSSYERPNRISRTYTDGHTVSEPTICESCRQPSPRVFRLGWTCLIPECQMFWRGPSTGHYINGDLSYDPQFLQLPASKSLPFGFRDVMKCLIKSNIGAETLRNYHFTRGFHCPSCGRLSSRSHWEKWECPSCFATLITSMPIHLAKDIWNQAPPISFRDYSINPISDIGPVSLASFKHETGRGFISSFTLPHFRGKIHLIQSGNPRGTKEADVIFEEYQKQAASGLLRFRRWPLRAHKCRGPLLTNYFSHNAGEPYKYVGGDANTVSFDSAPAVCAARALIQRRVKQALDMSVEFNEVLSAAYMERQKMAFHSDNEVGLGPVVAGLSLGSPALMHFRLHSRFDPEREKRGILLSIVLRHGDVLVMDGAGVQECYEHTVVPNNFRIAATARQIGVNHS